MKAAAANADSDDEDEDNEVKPLGRISRKSVFCTPRVPQGCFMGDR